MNEQEEDDAFIVASQRHSEIMDDGDRIYQLVKSLVITFLIVFVLVVVGIIAGVK